MNLELSINEFKILREISENGYRSQKALSIATGISAGTVNKVIRNLHDRNLLDNNRLTQMGIDALEPYKVQNAIILAAGKSSRFLPITYDLPKGLIVIDGEKIIERIIEQLQQAGIMSITLVVGYMAEKYLYLREKYGVNFIGNNEYDTKNNYVSLYVARTDLGNSYVCNSDIYFVSNPFHRCEYQSYFAVHHVIESSDDRGVSFDSTGLIYSTQRPARNQWATTGLAFIGQEFAEKYIPILTEYINMPGKEGYFWESVYAEHVKELPMYVRKFESDAILEFDELEDLSTHDPHYMLTNNFSIITHICKALKCKPEDVHGFDRMLGGFTNDTFRFEVGGRKYAYRRPGNNSGQITNRKREAIVTEIVAELGIDQTTVYIDPEQGWKVSIFFNEIEKFNYSRRDHKQGLADKMHMLHDDIHLCGYRFDLFPEALKIVELIRDIDEVAYEVLMGYSKDIHLISSYLDTDQWPVSLCHNDAKANICVADDGFKLIDWEYAGDTDIGFDLCKLYYSSRPSIEEMKKDLEIYYGREPTFEEMRHLIGCVAVCDFYWFVWNVWQSKGEKRLLHDSLFHFERMCTYKKLALKLYKYGLTAMEKEGEIMGE